MDKLIQLGIEARKNDTRIAQIETKCYSGEISSDEALDLVEKEIVRFNIAWGKIMKENQFMLDKQLEALNIN